MIITVFTLVFSIVAIVLAGFALWLAFQARIDAEAMKRSTHSVQLVPVDQFTPDAKADNDKDQREIHAQVLGGGGNGGLLDLGDDAF